MQKCFHIVVFYFLCCNAMQITMKRTMTMMRSTMPKHGIHDWSFFIRLVVYPFLVKLNQLLMPFLIIYAMCSCISLIIDAIFWRNGACCHGLLFCCCTITQRGVR